MAPLVPDKTRELLEQAGLPQPDWYVESAEGGLPVTGTDPWAVPAAGEQADLSPDVD